MKYKIILISAVLAAVLSACSSDDMIQDSIPDENSLSFTSGTVEIPPLGNAFSLSFSSDAAWTLRSSESWVNLSKTTGREGSYVVTLSVGINRTRLEREAVVSLENEKTGEVKEMHVTQTYPYLRMSVLDSEGNDSIVEDTVLLAWNMTDESKAPAKTITVESNVDWKIDTTDVCHGENFKFSSLSGSGNAKISMSAVNNNLDRSPFDLAFKIAGYLGKDSDEVIGEGVDTYSFNLHQKNLKFLINDQPEGAVIELSEINADENTDITVESEVEWSLTDCPDWLVIDNKSGEADQVVKVHFTADGANPTREVRQCTLKLDTKVGASRLIEISQRAYVLSLSANSVGLKNDDTDAHELNLNTTGTWEILNVPEWAEVSPLEGDGASVISVRSTSQNIDLSDLTSTLKVKSKMNDLFEDLELTQDRFVFNVTSPTTLGDLPTMSTKSYDVIIESSGAWEIVGKPSWVDVSSEHSASKGTYSVKVGPNCGNPDMSSDRSAELKVISLVHKEAGVDLSKTIKIKQRKYEFSVSESSFGPFGAYKASGKSAVVKCSAAWTASVPDWMVSDIMSGDGTEDATLTFTPKDNLQKSGRSGKIVITSTYNGETHEIAVEQDAFEFDSSAKSFAVPVMNTAGYTVSFALTSGASWMISSGNVAWIKASATSGTGSATLTFTPDPNPELTSRSAEVKILSELTGEEKTVRFNQDAYVFDKTEEKISVPELSVSAKTVSVICSGPWDATGAPEWLSLSPESGNTGGNLVITPSKNISHEGRTATITVTSRLNSLKKTITVAQDAFKFDSTPVNFHYASSEVRTDSFGVVCSGKWKASGVPSWVTLSKTSGAGNEAGTAETLTLVSTMNNTTEDRSAKIEITSEDNPADVKVINISQDKFVFEINRNEIVISDPLDVNEQVVELKSSAGWTVSSDQTWLSVAPSNGSGNVSIRLTPSKNSSSAERTANVTIKCTANDIKKVVTVKQAGYSFDSAPESYAIKAVSPDDLIVPITCTGNWTASSDASWLTLTPSGSKGDSKMKISATDNTVETERTADILVRSTDFPSLVKTIKVTQAKRVLEVSLTSLSFDADPGAAKTISVTTDGLWTASADQSWLTVTQDATNGNGTVSVSASENIAAERQAVITIKCVNTDISRTVTVTQAKKQESDPVTE